MTRIFLYPLLLIALWLSQSLWSQTVSSTDMENRAKESAQRLMKALKNNLMQAMARKGVVGAAKFCNEKAVALTDGVSSSLEEGWVVSRVSEKNRSPLNAPDKWDAKAFATHKVDPKKKSYWVEETDAEGSLLASRYYLPIRVMGQCIGCHGTAVSEEMKTFLNEKYPEDKALGYRPGDFRGFVKVRIPFED